MDPRVKRAQQLFWEIEAVRGKGVYPAALPQLLEMARLHEERAASCYRRATRMGGPIYSRPSPPEVRRGRGPRRIVCLPSAANSRHP